jgi:nitrogen fixation protein FixH
MTAAAKWTLAIVGLLGANVMAMVILAASAHHQAAQVIPGYYEQATHYDDSLDQAARNRAIGWRADVTVIAGTVEVRVHDALGASVPGAHVHVDGYQRSRSDDRFDLELVAFGDGVYRGGFDHGRTGWHDLTILIERQGQRFTQRSTVEAR